MDNEKKFTLRLSESQLKYIAKKAEKMRLSKNEYIRQLIDYSSQDEKTNRKLTEILAELKAIRQDLKKGK